MKNILTVLFTLFSITLFAQGKKIIIKGGISNLQSFDTSYARNDSVFYVLQGVEKFSHTMSGGGLGNLQQVTDAGNSTDTSVVVQGFKLTANSDSDYVALVKSAALNPTRATTIVGSDAGLYNNSPYLSAFGSDAAFGNSGDAVSAFGAGAGISNTYNNVTLLGASATASGTHQVVLANGKYSARFDVGSTQNYVLPNKSGTIALLDDITITGGAGINTLTTTGSTGAATKPNDSTINIPTPTIDGVLRNGNTTADQELFFGDGTHGLKIEYSGPNDYKVTNALGDKTAMFANDQVSVSDAGTGNSASFASDQISIATASDVNKTTITPNLISIQGGTGSLDDTTSYVRPTEIGFTPSALFGNPETKLKPVYGVGEIVAELGGSVAGGAVAPGNYVIALIGAVPSSSTDTGVPGQMAIDADYLYVCVATDTWVRFAKDAW